MTDSKLTATGPDRLSDYVKLLHGYYATYHHHKESMAYAGFTLYVTIAGAGLFSDSWPIKDTRALSIVAVLAIWTVTLVYLKFQLLRRRWAAIRLAGCERLLAKWINNNPVPGECEVVKANYSSKVSFATRIADIFWGSKSAVRAMSTDHAVYPRALVDEWKMREEDGSGAILHERLILIASWILTMVLVLHTWFAA